MDRLNFNHLRCFWATAKGGSIAKACETLGLTQPTISKQISDLEVEIGEPLFSRAGRRLVMTDLGRDVFTYADDIFSIGQEMLDAIRGHANGEAVRLRVGICKALPKLLACRLLQPAMAGETPVRFLCREGRAERLFAELGLGTLDVVLSGSPVKQSARLKAYCHKLGECPVGVFGTRELIDLYGKDLESGLKDAPLLLPAEGNPLRDDIDAWFDERGIRPRVVAEIEDSALTKMFAQAGYGLFFAPAIITSDIEAQFGVSILGAAEGLAQPLYAITTERRITHPGVAAIADTARGIFQCPSETPLAQPVA